MLLLPILAAFSAVLLPSVQAFGDSRVSVNYTLVCPFDPSANNPFSFTVTMTKSYPPYYQIMGQDSLKSPYAIYKGELKGWGDRWPSYQYYTFSIMHDCWGKETMMTRELPTCGNATACNYTEVFLLQ